MYDLIIIGGGPAGAAAGVYAARKKIRSLLITEDFGGQSVMSPEVQNFVGIVSLPGAELASRLKKHLQAYAEDILDIIEGDIVENLKHEGNHFLAQTREGKEYQARAILVCSGSRRRKLKIPGAERLDNKGISYCASCDAPLFKDKDVAVIGGGNAGLEAAQQLLEHASSVVLLEYAEEFKADPVTVEKVLANKKMTALKNAEVTEIYGENFVEGLKYKDRKTGEEYNLKLGGVFVEIGSIPNSGFLGELVEKNDYNEIKVDCRNNRTSLEGIWAAGDVSDVRFKQNNIAMGDAVLALEDIYLWLQKNNK